MQLFKLKSILNSTVATHCALHKGALTMIFSLFARKKCDFDKCESCRHQSNWHGFAPSSIWIHHDKISHEDLSDNNLFDDKLSYDNL